MVTLDAAGSNAIPNALRSYSLDYRLGFLLSFDLGGAEPSEEI